MLSMGSGPGLAPQLKVLAVLTLLSLLPAIVLTMTSFTRIVVVLSFVKQGLGTQQTPPAQVLVGIALFLTAFTMAPITQAIMTDAYEPYSSGKIDESTALTRATTPLRAFMLRQTREADLALFYDAAKQPMPAPEEEVPMARKPAFASARLRQQCVSLAAGMRDCARSHFGGVPPSQARRQQLQKEKAAKNRPDHKPKVTQCEFLNS